MARLTTTTALIGLAAIVAVAIAPAIESLGVLWLDTANTTYTHGFLIAGVSAWFLWRRRQEFSDAEPVWVGARIALLAVLAALLIAWQIAWRAGIQMGYLLLLPAIVLAAIGSMLGGRALRAAFFPLAFLYFAMPVWDLINPAAQELTVRVVRLMLTATGVPSYFEGNTVQIPAGTFEIEGGCSGLHFIIVAASLGALLGELREDGWPARLKWIAIALALALVSNWLRVYLIILAGHLTQMQHYIVRVSHYGFGWAVFAAALVVLFMLERRAPPTNTPAGAARAPESPPMARWVAITWVLIALPAIANVLISARVVAGPGVPAAPRVAGWVPASDPAPGWRPRQPGADLEQRFGFSRGDARIALHVAWYREQAGRKKVGGFGARAGGDAEVIESNVVEIAGRSYTLERVTQLGREALLLREYRVAERQFARATHAQLNYGVRAALTLSSPPASVWILRGECASDCRQARAALEEFVTRLVGGEA